MTVTGLIITKRLRPHVELTESVCVPQDSEISAFELKKILNRVVTKRKDRVMFGHDGLSCSSAVTLSVSHRI